MPRTTGTLRPHFNVMVDCRMCGKRTHSTIDGNSGLDLCRDCIEESYAENDHYDTNHVSYVDGGTSEYVKDCPICTPAVNIARQAREIAAQSSSAIRAESEAKREAARATKAATKQAQQDAIKRCTCVHLDRDGKPFEVCTSRARKDTNYTLCGDCKPDTYGPCYYSLNPAQRTAQQAAYNHRASNR